jgi:hypothetical protein
MRHVLHADRALWCTALASLLAACADTGVNLSRPISLSITTASSRTFLPAASGLAAAIQVGSGANSLSITQAQATLERIELAGSGSCAGDPAEADEMPGEPEVEHDAAAEDDCAELRIGPTLVTLPVDGTTKVILDALVPAGTYSGVDAQLDSVKVTGVYTDATNQMHSFTFTAGIDASLEASFQPPVTVGSGTSNVTVDVDIASWFKDASGAVVDPTNPASAATITANIRRSVHAFQDDDHDGRDDHAEGAGDH